MGKQLNAARLLCDNFHILREAVLRCDLICLCSRAFVAEDLAAGRLCELNVQDLAPVQLTIFCAWLKGRILSPLAKTIIKRIGGLLLADHTNNAKPAKARSP